MNTAAGTLGFNRKVNYSIIGLFAGDFVMLILFSLISKSWEQPSSYFLRAVSFSFGCSLFGWVAIGIPAVFLINTAFLAKLRWFREILIGVLLGPAALLIIFMTIGNILPPSPGGFAIFWIFAALVSTVAFSIFCALVRQALQQQEKEDSILPAKDEQLQILRPLARIDINESTDSELPLDIYNSDWLNTLEPSDPRRSTSGLSRPPGSKPS